MVVYLTSFILSIAWIVFFSKRYVCVGRKRYNLQIWSIVPLFIVASIRYNVGTDYEEYVNIFYRISMGINYTKEPLYRLLNSYVAKLGGTYVAVFAICAFLFLYFTYSQIIKDSIYPGLSVILLFGTTYYFCFLNGMRQLIAAAILLYSIRFIEEKDLFKFSLFVLLATGFHYSSILFFIIYFMSKMELTPKKVLFISVGIFAFSELLVNIGIRIISITPYAKYIDSIFDTGSMNWIRFLIQVSVLVFCSFFYSNTEKYRIYYSIQFITTCVIGFSGKIVLIRRLMWTFGLATLIIIPLAIGNIKSKGKRMIAYFVICVTYFIYAYISIAYLGIQGVIPYQTIWHHN